MAISLKSVSDRISKLDGVKATTPIYLKDLDARVVALENKPAAKRYVITQLSKSGVRFNIPSEYASWDWYILNINGYARASGSHRFGSSYSQMYFDGKNGYGDRTNWENHGGPCFVQFRRHGNQIAIYFNDRAGLNPAESYELIQNNTSLTCIFLEK